jgi:hypothetical protein
LNPPGGGVHPAEGGVHLGMFSAHG